MFVHYMLQHIIGKIVQEILTKISNESTLKKSATIILLKGNRQHANGCF